MLRENTQTHALKRKKDEMENLKPIPISENFCDSFRAAVEQAKKKRGKRKFIQVA